MEASPLVMTLNFWLPSGNLQPWGDVPPSYAGELGALVEGGGVGGGAVPPPLEHHIPAHGPSQFAFDSWHQPDWGGSRQLFHEQ